MYWAPSVLHCIENGGSGARLQLPLPLPSLLLPPTAPRCIIPSVLAVLIGGAGAHFEQFVPCRKRLLSQLFRCQVCPEPVLANQSFHFYMIKWLKKGRFSHRRSSHCAVDRCVHVDKTVAVNANETAGESNAIVAVFKRVIVYLDAIFEQFLYKNDHFAKTGSGQT